MGIKFCVPSLMLLALLPAQRTWTVDLLNRPGTDFLDLPAAVATAAPGDVLRVRWVDPLLQQYYLLPTITRAVTILGEGVGPSCMGTVRVIGLPAGEQVVITRLRIGTPEITIFMPPPPGVVVQDCLGVVAINSCVYGSLTAAWATTGFIVERSALVHIHDCTLWQAASYFTFRDSPIVAEGSSFLPPTYGLIMGVVMQCSHSEVWLVDSVVQGEAPSMFLPNGGWAVQSCNSVFHLAGSSRVVSGDPVRSPGIGGWSPCPGFFNTAYVDPRAQVTGVNGTIIRTPIPAQLYTLDTQRTTLATTTYGHSNCATVQAWAFTPTGPVSSPYGSMFLDPLACFVVDIGLTDGTGRRQRSFAIPPGLPPQLTLAIQTIQLTPTGGLQLANVTLPNLW